MKSEQYDVALSFAGEDRKYVEEVATELKRLGVRVFYDKFETVNLWGKDLYTHLQDVYEKQAKYTVVFISVHYAKKLWTNHERKMAQARAFTEPSEYILPARFDDTEIKGITKTIGYIDLRQCSPKEFSTFIFEKIKAQNILPKSQVKQENSRGRLSTFYSENWRWVLGILLVILLIFTIYYFLSSQITKTFTHETVQFWINISNLLVSLYFLLFLNSPKISIGYNIKKEKEYDFCELAGLEIDIGQKRITEKSSKILITYQQRVARLINQYLWIICLFAISLAFVYVSVIVSSINGSSTTENFRLATNQAINIFNFLGGIIVFMGFKILYSATLNKYDEANRFWLIPSMLATIYIFTFISLSWQLPNENASYFLNIFNLITGLISGMTMFLIIGRYISLEASLSKTNLFRDAFKDLFKNLPPYKSEKSYTKIVLFGITLILSVYAVAQPLFSVSNSVPKVFQTVLYGICLVGKICFFQLTFLLINKKLLHLYFYGLVSKISNFRELEKCLSVSSSDD